MFSEHLIVFFSLCLLIKGFSSLKEDKNILVLNHKGDENPKNIVSILGETLELTCYLNIDDEEAKLYQLSWHYPSHTKNSQMRQRIDDDGNQTTLRLEHLQESDSGEYLCEALRSDPKEMLQRAFDLIVKTRRGDRCEKMFVCETNICIAQRFECDGYPDCKNGADESIENCGNDPCSGKIKCDNRCIPVTDCCYPYGPNCSTRHRPDCCPKLKKDTYLTTDSVFFTNPNHLNEMNFLQTTIYTVIGCAMVFMLIVTILVIAICRVHMKRSLLSTFPPRHHRMNTTAYHRTLTQEMGVCDVDVYLNREVPAGVLVTYNINNGVQILSDTVEPPPYSEVMTVPPREGPPPPYSIADGEEESVHQPLNPTSWSRSPKPDPRPGTRRGLSSVQVSSEPALSTLH